MRSSAIAGFLASAVFVSGSAGFASTFLVGPYLGAHVRHQPAREALMSSAAPVDPLAAVQTAARTASLEGEPAASQEAHRLRNVENTPQPAAPTPAAPKPVVAAARTTPAPAPAPTVDTSNSDPGPITEAAFTTPTPPPAPVSSGGPLIAAETSTSMMSSKLENGEPVLTLRVVPVVAAAPPAADTDPDNAAEPTVISAPPAEQALAAPAMMTTATAPAAAVAPTPAPEPEHQPPARPRVKPALQAAAPAPEPTHRPARTREKPPGRVTTIAAPAKEVEPPPAPAPVPVAPDPLNAPYIPPSEEPSAATGAPASMTPSQPQSAPPPSSGGPTPLTMPQ
jgi:hypothetical protein